jgi:hypothetical protein
VTIPKLAVDKPEAPKAGAARRVGRGQGTGQGSRRRSARGRGPAARAQTCEDSGRQDPGRLGGSASDRAARPANSDARRCAAAPEAARGEARGGQATGLAGRSSRGRGPVRGTGRGRAGLGSPGAE